MRRIIIGTSIITSVFGTIVLAGMAWRKTGKHDAIIGERYSILMRSAKNERDKEIIEEIYKTEKQLEALAEILNYHRAHRIECEDLCLRESQVVGKFNDLEEQLSEELRIISRGL